MKLQGYSVQTPITFPQLLRGDHRALYKPEDCLSIYALRVSKKLKASLWLSTTTYGDQITETSILSLPTKTVTRASCASWCALELDSAPLSTCRYGDYIQGLRGERRLQSETVVSCCCALFLMPCYHAACIGIVWLLPEEVQMGKLFLSRQMSAPPCFIPRSFQDFFSPTKKY